METTENHNSQLLDFLCKIAPVSEGYQQRLLQQLKTHYFNQKELLISPGEIARRVYFIKNGLLRSYHLDSSGKQFTNYFMATGALVTSTQSFFNQTPATEYIEVLQNSELQSLTFNELNSYYADFPESNFIGRIILQRYCIQAEQRNTLMRIPGLKERYENLLALHPNIEQQISLGLIATYLNTSRETLSRLRSQIVKNKIN